MLRFAGTAALGALRRGHQPARDRPLGAGGAGDPPGPGWPRRTPPRTAFLPCTAWMSPSAVTTVNPETAPDLAQEQLILPRCKSYNLGTFV